MNTRPILATLTLLIGLCTIMTPLVVTAEDCTDYSDYLRWVAYDNSCAANNSAAVGVTVDGNHAYVAAATTGLVIYEVSDPTNPTRLGTANTPFSSRRVIIDGDLAYVADWDEPGFCVIDVADPSAPAVIGMTGNTPSAYYWDLAQVNPDTVYVVDLYYGIRIVDVSDPTAPDLYNLVAASTYTFDIDVAGNEVYVCGSDGLHVLDATIAGDPEIIGYLPLPNWGVGIDAVGALVYVACGESGLQIVDVTEPEDPQILGAIGEAGELGPVTYVHVVGDLAYVTKICDSGCAEGMAIIDVSDPTAPVLVNTLTIADDANDIFVAGDHAYVAAATKGLLVADVSVSASPAFVGSLEIVHPYRKQGTEYYPLRLATSGNHAYLLDTVFGLHVVDISEPQNPFIVGSLEILGDGYGIVLEGTTAYVAAYSGGLQIIDIANPTAPGLIGSVTPFGNQVEVAVQGDHAYLAARDWGMQIIDITDPSAPVERGSLDPGGLAIAVAVAGDNAYLAWDDYVTDEFYVADIADPYAPSIVGSLELPGEAVHVRLARGHAFVCGMAEGLHVINIDYPTAPVLVSTLLTPGQVYDVVVDGDLAYIADVEGGLQVADYTDLAAPRYLGCMDTPDHWAYGVALADDRVCMVDWTGGFHIAWEQCEATPVLPEEVPVQRLALESYPNPFNPQTTISFTLARPERATVGIYTLAGRRIDVLADEIYAAGPHTVTWNGRDTQGRSMPSGAYLVRLETASGAEARKVMLVK